MTLSSLLGLPLEAALAELKRAGIGPVKLQYTAPLKLNRAREGAPRVIAVRDSGRLLVVSNFQDTLHISPPQ